MSIGATPLEVELQDLFGFHVTWIARHVRGIDDLLVHVDDSFKVVPASSMSFYEPYHKPMPEQQIALLNLWTEIGIPFKRTQTTFWSPIDHNQHRC